MPELNGALLEFAKSFSIRSGDRIEMSDSTLSPVFFRRFVDACASA